MKHACVFIAMLEYGLSERGRPVLRDTTWWQDLIVNRCAGATEFILRCREDDDEGKAFGERSGWLLMRSITGEWVYRGACTEAFFAELLAFPSAGDGALAGSELHLLAEGRMEVSLREYGLELYLHGLTEQQTAQARAWASRYLSMADPVVHAQ